MEINDMIRKSILSLMVNGCVLGIYVLCDSFVIVLFFVPLLRFFG